MSPTKKRIVSILFVFFTALLIGFGATNLQKENVKTSSLDNPPIVKQYKLEKAMAQEERLIYKLNPKTMKIYQVGVIEKGETYEVILSNGDNFQVLATTYDSVRLDNDIVLIDQAESEIDKQSF